MHLYGNVEYVGAVTKDVVGCYIVKDHVTQAKWFNNYFGSSVKKKIIFNWTMTSVLLKDRHLKRNLILLWDLSFNTFILFVEFFILYEALFRQSQILPMELLGGDIKPCRIPMSKLSKKIPSKFKIRRVKYKFTTCYNFKFSESIIFKDT